jgi:glycosyltransferase involved in cell wall biosynthesis
MKLVIVYPALPPKLDGIGDYSARIASALSISHQVVFLTASQQPLDPVEGVRVVQCFQSNDPRSNWQLADRVREERPDWVIVQYNPFSWGRRGLNLQLHRVMRRMRADAKVAIMYHERYFGPVAGWRTALMAGWQRWQYRRLVGAADLCFYSTEPWVDDHRRRFPGKPACHMPVGSNIPLMDGSREEARRTLEINPDTIVLGVFGSAHVSRLLDWIRLGAEKLRATGADVLLLYIGPDREVVTRAMGDVPVRCLGPLGAEEVSLRLRAMDIYLSPFADGVATRRTSFLVALQHGIATVSTTGRDTGPLLTAQAGRAFLLTPVDQPAAFAQAVVQLAADSSLRSRLGQEGASFFQSAFSWEHLAAQAAADLLSHAR